MAYMVKLRLWFQAWNNPLYIAEQWKQFFKIVIREVNKGLPIYTIGFYNSYDVLFVFHYSFFSHLHTTLQIASTQYDIVIESCSMWGEYSCIVNE